MNEWTQHEKCIQMSANKPSIEPVVSEMFYALLEEKSENFTAFLYFYPKTVTIA